MKKESSHANEQQIKVKPICEVDPFDEYFEIAGTF